MSKSRAFPWVKFTAAPPRSATGRSVIAKWSKAFHVKVTAPAGSRRWMTVPVTCASATPPTPERSIVRVSSHRSQAVPSARIRTSWNRVRKPPAQARVPTSAPSRSSRMKSSTMSAARRMVNRPSAWAVKALRLPLGLWWYHRTVASLSTMTPPSGKERTT